MTTVEDEARFLEAVDGALRLSAPFLASRPGRLPGQLTGRLIGSADPAAGPFLSSIRDRAPRPWLCPLTPALAAAGGPLQRVLLGHTDQVNAVAVTPNGTRIVSGAGGLMPPHDDNTVRVWDLASGRQERTLQGHTDLVNAVAVTPDGSRIISGSDDETVRVWDLASGHLERTLEGDTHARAVAAT